MRVNETLKKVSGQTFWQLSGKLITALSTLLLLSLIARSYGESGTGVYTLAITYLAFFNLAADLGVNAYGLRFVESSAAIFHKILGFRLIWSGMLLLFAVVGSFLFVSKEPVILIAILCGVFSIVGSSIYTTTNLVFQSKFRYDLSIIASILSSFVSLLIIVLLIHYDFSLSYLTLGHTAGWLVCALLAIFLVKRFVSLHFVFDWDFVKKMMRANWAVSLTMILNVVYFRIDTFILSYHKSLAEVGIYNFGYQFFSNALVVPTFMMNALYPLFLRVYERSSTALLPFLVKSCLGMGLLGLFGTIITYLLSPFLIPFISGGSGFSGSIEVLQILSFSFPAFFLSAVLMWGLVTIGLQKQMLIVYLFGLLINLVGNFIFIPTYSYIAASWVTVVCEYLILLMQIIILGIFYRQR